MNKHIQQYCKDNKITFVKYTAKGFISKFRVAVRAGMKHDIHTGNMISIPIKKIGSKVVYYNHILLSNNDIIWNNKVINNL